MEEKEPKKSWKIRHLLLLVIFICLSRSAMSHACDCHADGDYVQVCLYTNPSQIDITSETFNFDVVVRNYYRGGTLTNIQTSVQSCSGPSGACTWSASGNDDFNININPSQIGSTQSGSGPGDVGNYDPDTCRNLGYGSTDDVNVEITIRNAPDGAYSIRFRVGWDPQGRERYLDVDFDFSSTGGCTSNNDCTGGQICCNDDCIDAVCSSNNDCGTAPTCQTYTCQSSGTCTSSCQTSNAPNGQVCSGDCTVCNNGQCNQNDNSQCASNEQCQSGTCVYSGCTSNNDCSGSTPFCNTGTGDCVECQSAGDCDDSDECTTDTCSSGTCQNSNAQNGASCTTCGGQYCECQSGSCIELGCVSAADCDDSNLCTTDACVSDSCQFTDLVDGTACSNCGGSLCECRNAICTLLQCTVDADCDDNNQCTANTCINGFCEYPNVAEDTVCTGCRGEQCACSDGNCLTDICSGNSDCTAPADICSEGKCVECVQTSDCDDTDSCTYDSCNSGICQHINITNCGATECTDTCQSLGYNCGTHTICDQSQNCGSCGRGKTCTAGQCDGTSCTESCGSLGFDCGIHTVCTQSKDCGSCASGECQDGKCIEPTTDSTDTPSRSTSGRRRTATTSNTTQTPTDQITDKTTDTVSDSSNMKYYVLGGVILVIAVAFLLMMRKPKSPQMPIQNTPNQFQQTNQSTSNVQLMSQVGQLRGTGYSNEQIRSILIQRGFDQNMVDILLRR